jgi:hypothetical protein
MKNSWTTKFLAFLICLVANGFVPNDSKAADPVLGPEAAKTIPLADGHFHIMAWMDIKRLLEYMDRAGIRWAGGAGTVGSFEADRSRNAEAATVLGNRYIRSTGQRQWLSLKQQGGMAALEDADSPAFRDALAAIETDLRDHGARVIGEIFVNTLQTPSSPFGQNKMRANAPTLRALLNLAGKYRRPLSLHAQWVHDTAIEFQQLAQSNRDARLILAHCGLAAVPDVRALFQHNPNVDCDLSHRSPPQLNNRGFGRVLGKAVFDSGLSGDWKVLIEEFPDRFIVGLDGQETWEDYEATVHNIRFGLLANLSPQAAEMVAYKNAQAWFALE